MVNFLNGLFYGIGGLACTCLVLLVTLQEKLVYVPVIPGLGKDYPITPARFRLKYEDVWLLSSDGVRLHSWFIKLRPECRGTKTARRKHSYRLYGQSYGLCGPYGQCTNCTDCTDNERRTDCAGSDGGQRAACGLYGQRPTILFFQENAGNIAHRLEFVDTMIRFLQCNVFMLSYRGYGASEGYPSQQGLIRDAQAALNHLLERTDIDTTKLVVFGRSLGGAVGSAIVKRNPGKVSVLILENTFTSVLDMAGVMLPFLKWFIGGTGSRGPKFLNFLVRSPWRTIDIVNEISEPILFLSGLQDEMVPPSHMKRLYDASHLNSKRLFIEFPLGMHMDTWLTGGDRYWRTIQLFLARHVVNIHQREDGNIDFLDNHRL